ncbi:hypothetical protein LY78DRAFT_40001 [Colletotrichum sublineola]|nr:hypothetical protein LY78DRAFT_40001 [Colletotrichum sublineola]
MMDAPSSPKKDPGSASKQPHVRGFITCWRHAAAAKKRLHCRCHGASICLCVRPSVCIGISLRLYRTVGN